MKEIGHAERVSDVLKIDCESCERHTFKDWMHFDFRQNLVQAHDRGGVNIFYGLTDARYIQ